MFEADIALGIQCNICFDEFREDNVRRKPRIRSLSLLCSLRACLHVHVEALFGSISNSRCMRRICSALCFGAPPG